jgi:hypothetical protein
MVLGRTTSSPRYSKRTLVLHEDSLQVKSQDLKAATEKTQSDRHAVRATKKRVSKRKRREQEEAEGVWAHEKGIKSAREDAQAAREAAALNKRGNRGKLSFGKSASRSSAGVKVKTTDVPKNTTEVFRTLEAAKASGSKHEGNSGKHAQAASAQTSAKFMY